MFKLSFSPRARQALKSLLTPTVAIGAVISVGVGAGLGAWLKPPKPHYAGDPITVNLPHPAADPWAASSSGISISQQPQPQPEAAPPPDQTAAVSPPADDATDSQDAAADQPDDATDGPSPPQQPAPSPYAARPPVQLAYGAPPARAWRPPPPDWTDYGPPRGGDYDDEDMPPPPRWDRPPPRRWAPPPRPPGVFGPDGSAYPTYDDGDDDDG